MKYNRRSRHTERTAQGESIDASSQERAHRQMMEKGSAELLERMKAVLG